jgi:glycosyltransferase involved in cell wall biosynthesis
MALRKYLNDEITEIHILSHNEGRGLSDKEDSKNIVVHRLFDSTEGIRKNFAFIKIFLAIYRLRPNLVHFEYSPMPKGKYGGLIGETLLLLFFLLKLKRIPFFVTLHSIWLSDQAESRLFELIGNRFISKLAWYYFMTVMHFFGTMPKRLLLLVAKTDPEIVKKFSKTYKIPTSKLREELHGIWWLDNKEMAETSKKRSRKIVCLGVIRPSKGYEYTLMAMRTVVNKFPDASLVIAGMAISGEGKKYVQMLRRLVKDYALDASVVIEERYLSDSEFSEYVSTSGLVVLPYTRVVGASSILSSALSYRVPVILSSSGPFFQRLSDILPIISPFDHVALAQEIVHILGSEEYFTELVERYQVYASEHDWSVVVKRIYNEFLSSIER